MHKKLFLIAIAAALIFINCGETSSPISGYWTGVMEMNGKTVDIAIDLNHGQHILSSNDLMLRDIPLTDLKYKDNRIAFSFDLDVSMSFEGTIKNNRYQGTVKMVEGPPELKIRFALAKKSENTPTKNYVIENLTIQNKDVKLSAQVYKPKTSPLHPALVLLHGSSTNLKSNYTFYADFFASMGFEVLIFDKRGNGDSTGNYVTANYSDLVGDAICCLETMRNRAGIDKGKIGLWGFSQGAMLLPMIASKSDIPAFLIAKSPEVTSVTEAAAYSDKLRLINSGNSAADAEIAAESHREIEKMILSGSNYKDVQRFINRNARKYPFMNRTGLYGNMTISKDEFEGYYWKDRTVNFRSSWKNLKIPTLVLFGQDDAYVDAGKNAKIIHEFRNDNIETKLFPRGNHSIKKSINPAKYGDFDWPRVVEGYLDYVKEWITRTIIKI